MIRARYPDADGFVERDGVRTYYEVYGEGDATIFFLPTWSLVHSRIWKQQVPYFARRFRVVTMDGRGNGRSDRPVEPSAYEPLEFARDALAVMDATETERAILVSTSAGTSWNLIVCAMARERVEATVLCGPTVYGVSEPFPDWATAPFNDRFDSYEGFQGQNRYFIGEHYREFAEWWIRLCIPEPHSGRAHEFTLEMALETTPEVVLATLDAVGMREAENSAERLAQAGEQLRPLARGVTCPALVIQGALERAAPLAWAEALAKDTGGELVVIEDAGHGPMGRKPVRFNLELRRFVERVRLRTPRAAAGVPETA